MSSLVDLPELVGFFSYSREDDKDSHGALSTLRTRIQGELRGQLGRTAKTFRLWQDKEAIPSGTLWETEIKNAVGQAVFFIPIITPTVIASPYCRFELESFLAREAALGRDDLVFPILYIEVPALEDAALQQNDPVLSLIARRQYVDWSDFRYLDVNSTEVRRAVGRFCTDVRNALYRPLFSLEEREQQEGSETPEQAEVERQRQRTAVKRGTEEKRPGAPEEQREERPDAERNRIAGLEAKTRDEEVGFREGAEAKQRTEAQERRGLELSQARTLWPPSRSMLAAGSIVGVTLLGAIGVWLTMSKTSVTVAPQPPASVTPAPAPITPTPAPVTPTLPEPAMPAPAHPSRTQRTANGTLSGAQEQALKPGDTFKECTSCPWMVVLPAGAFKMGSPANEDNTSDQRPQHTVTIGGRFAVGQYDLTFDQWDACVADGGCNAFVPSDNGWGRGRQPVINVSWDDAEAYVAWLSQKTGKPYRLLSEGEYEYSTRAGTTTTYPWGDDIGRNNANCNGCGSQWDGKKTAPVGAFAPNRFGLYDMVGNVAAWTEDCYHDSFSGAPTDGSAWTRGDCSHRVVRGGSWLYVPRALHSASRGGYATDGRGVVVGFRVGRTLLTP
jgi:formylglycine-generating enzyme required for sulfatase activity